MSIYDNLEEVDGLSVRHEMSSHVEGKKTVYDEWCAEAYMKTDYSDLSQKNFQKTLSNYLSYLVRDAGYITDLQYIENYINYLYYKLIKTKNEKHSINLNSKLWKEFKIQSLFDVVLSKGDIKIDDVEQGNIPLISSGESNNGIIGYINEDGDDKAEIFKGNAITVDMFCNAFYQKLPFYAVSHGRVNILLPKFELTSNIALFICTLIKHEQYRFSYGRAVYSSVCEKIKIKLPALLNSQTNEYEPDWQFMEDYIKALPYGDRI